MHPVTPWTVRVLLTVVATFGPVLSPSGSAAQVPDSTSTVRGRVVKHENGEPLTAASVSLAPAGEEEEGLLAQTTGGEGGLDFGEAQPGLYRLEVSLLGYHSLLDTLRADPASAGNQGSPWARFRKLATLRTLV